MTFNLITSAINQSIDQSYPFFAIEGNAHRFQGSGHGYILWVGGGEDNVQPTTVGGAWHVLTVCVAEAACTKERVEA